MADLPLGPVWTSGVYQLETTDPVLGGAGGIANLQATQLGQRTDYLYDRISSLGEAISTLQTWQTGTQENLDALNFLRNYFGGASASVRHGLCVCPENTIGIPSFLQDSDLGPSTGTVTLSLSNTLPLAGTISVGHNTDGPGLHYFYFHDEINLPYTGGGDRLLIVETDNDGVPAVSLIPYFLPYVSYNAPTSVPTGTMWFNLNLERMFRWSGSAWQAKNILILASVFPGDEQYSYYPTVRVGAKDLFGAGVVPAGSVIAFAGANPPAGYLRCDGSTPSRSLYSKLFGAIGTTYGTGNGTTTFNIPDLRAEFIRGLDAGRGVDTGRTIGSTQSHAIQAHTHLEYFTSGVGGGYNTQPIGAATALTREVSNISTGDFVFSEAETRPRNVAMNYCIKF